MIHSSKTSSNRPEREQITENETLLRAITTGLYDDKNNRPSSAAFTGEEVSLSRPSITPIEDLEPYFRRTLAKPEKDPPLEYLGYASMENFALQELGRKVDQIEALSVWADPLSDNLAHAVILGKISRGLSKKVRALCEFRLGN